MGMSWTRDTEGQAVAVKRPSEALERPQPRVFKRKANVWVRNGGQTQQEAVNEPQLDAEALAKRRRLMAQGRLPRETNNQVTSSDVPCDESHRTAREPVKSTPKASSSSQHASHRPQAQQNGRPEDHNQQAEDRKKQAEDKRKEVEDRKKQAELIERIKQQIAEQEANIAAIKEDKRRKQEAELAQEQRYKEEQALRKRRLQAGLAEAFQLRKEMLATDENARKIAPASAAEVKRVLSAKTDHEVMQTRPGISRLLVRKKYKVMTMTLHPDKCQVEGAKDAFQRMVTAYQAVLRSAV